MKFGHIVDRLGRQRLYLMFGKVVNTICRYHHRIYHDSELGNTLTRDEDCDIEAILDSNAHPF